MAGVDRLCFGTSTFVAGRLRPDKDSAPGLAALRTALEHGVRLIHSNPELHTQWAVRDVLDQFRPQPPVRHMIKAEAPLDAQEHVIASKVATALDASRARLGIGRIHVLVLEIDIKQTLAHELLDDPTVAEQFYRQGAHAALTSGHVDHVYAYCHLPAHVAGALACPDIAGVTAQYHQANPWPAHYFCEITSAGRIFVGMSPLDRGALVDREKTTPMSRLAALKWALVDPRVSATAITMSSVMHVSEVIRVADAVNSSTNGKRPQTYKSLES